MLASALSKYDSSTRSGGQDDKSMSAAALARLVVRGDDSGRVTEPGGEALDETFITATLALDASRRNAARELEAADSPFQGAIDDAKDKFIDLALTGSAADRDAFFNNIIMTLVRQRESGFYKMMLGTFKKELKRAVGGSLARAEEATRRAEAADIEVQTVTSRLNRTVVLFNEERKQFYKNLLMLQEQVKLARQAAAEALAAAGILDLDAELTGGDGGDSDGSDPPPLLTQGGAGARTTLHSSTGSLHKHRGGSAAAALGAPSSPGARNAALMDARRSLNALRRLEESITGNASSLASRLTASARRLGDASESPEATDMRELEEENDKLRRDLDEAHAAISRLAGEASSRYKQVVDLREKYAALRGTLSGRDGEVADVKQTVLALEKQLQVAQAENEALVAELEAGEGGEGGASSPSVGGSTSGLASLVSPGSRGGGFSRRNAAAGPSAADTAWFGPQATHWGRAARGALRSAVAQGTAQWRGGAAGVVELLMDPDLRAAVQDAYTALTLSGEVAAVEAGAGGSKGGLADAGGGAARSQTKIGGVSLKGSAARKRRGRNTDTSVTGDSGGGGAEARGGGALGFLSGGGASHSGGLDGDEDAAEALATAVADVEMLQAQLHSSNSNIKSLQGEVRALKAAATRERGLPPPRDDTACQTDESWLQHSTEEGDGDETASDAGSEAPHRSGLSMTGHTGGSKGGRRPIRRRDDKRRGGGSPRGSKGGKGGKGGSGSNKPSATRVLGGVKPVEGGVDDASERPSSASSSYRPSTRSAQGGAVYSHSGTSSARDGSDDTRDAPETRATREGTPPTHGQGPWAFLPGDGASAEDGAAAAQATNSDASAAGGQKAAGSGKGSGGKGAKGGKGGPAGRPDTSHSTRSVRSVEDSREMRVIAKLQASLAEEEKYSAMLERKLKRAAEEGGGLKEKNAQLKRELRAAVAAVEAARTKLAQAAAAGGGAEGGQGGGALQLLQAYQGPAASMLSGDDEGASPRAGAAAGDGASESFLGRPRRGGGREGAASPPLDSLRSARPPSSLHGRTTPEGIRIEEAAPDDDEIDVEEPSFVVRSIGGGAGGGPSVSMGASQTGPADDRQGTTGVEAETWESVPGGAIGDAAGDDFSAGPGSAVGSARGGMMGLGDDEGGMGGGPPSSRASSRLSGAQPHDGSASMSWRVAVRSVGIQVGAAGGKPKAESRKPPVGRRRRAFNSDGTAAPVPTPKPTSWWEVEQGVTAGTQTRITGSVLPLGEGGGSADQQMQEEAIQAIMAEMQMGTSDADLRASSPRSEGSGTGQRSPVPSVLASNPGTGPSREDLAETVLRLKREVARWKYHVSETQRSTSSQGGGGTDYAALDRAVSRGGSRGGSRAGTFVPGNLPAGSSQMGSFPLGGGKGGVYRPSSSHSAARAGTEDTRVSGSAWGGVAAAGADGAAAAIAASEAVLRTTAERVRVLEDTVTHLLSGPEWRLTGDDAAGTAAATVATAQAAAAAAVVLQDAAAGSGKGGAGGDKKSVKWQGVQGGTADAADALFSLAQANKSAAKTLAAADVHSISSAVKGGSKWLQRLLASYTGAVLAQHAAVTGEVLTSVAEGKSPEGGVEDPAGGSDDEALAAAVHKQMPARVTWLALAKGVEGSGQGGKGALRESLLFTRLSAALVGVFGGKSDASNIPHMPPVAPNKDGAKGGVPPPFAPPTTGWLVLNLLQATEQWQQAQVAVAASKWQRLAWAAKAHGLLPSDASGAPPSADGSDQASGGVSLRTLAATLREAHHARDTDVHHAESAAGKRVVAAVSALVQMAPWATPPPMFGGGALPYPVGGGHPGEGRPPMPSDSMMQYRDLGGPTSVYRGPMPPQQRAGNFADPAAAAAAAAASGWWGAPRPPPQGGDDGDPVDTSQATGGNRGGTVFRGRAGTGPGGAGGMHGGGVWMSDGTGEEGGEGGYQFGAPPPHLAHLYGGMDAASLLRVAAGGGMRPGDASYLTQAARAMVASQGMPPPWYMQGGVASPEEWQAAVAAAQGGRAPPGGGPSYFNVQGGAAPTTAGPGGVFPVVDPRVPPPMYQSQDGALWNPFYNYAAVTLYHTAYGEGGGVRGQRMAVQGGDTSGASGPLRTTVGGPGAGEAGRRDRGLLYAPEALQESKQGGGGAGAGGVVRGASFRIPAFAASRGPSGETLAPGAGNIWADAAHTARGGAAANLGGVLGRKMSLPSMAEMRALEAAGGGGVGASRGRRLRAASGVESEAGSDAAAAAGSEQGDGGGSDAPPLHHAASGRTLLVAGETPHPPRASRRRGLARSATLGGGAMMGQAASRGALPAVQLQPQPPRMAPVAEVPAPAPAVPLQRSELHLNLGTQQSRAPGGQGPPGAASAQGGVPPSPLLTAGTTAVLGPQGGQHGGLGMHGGAGPMAHSARQLGGGRPDSEGGASAVQPWQAAFTDHVFETQARRGGGRRRWAEVPEDADSLQVNSARMRPRARGGAGRLHESSRL